MLPPQHCQCVDEVSRLPTAVMDVSMQHEAAKTGGRGEGGLGDETPSHERTKRKKSERKRGRADASPVIRFDCSRCASREGGAPGRDLYEVTVVLFSFAPFFKSSVLSTQAAAVASPSEKKKKKKKKKRLQEQ